MNTLKALFIVFGLFCASHIAQAQRDLCFNQVIVLKSGSNYTVPQGKVFKVESVNIDPKAKGTLNNVGFNPQNGCIYDVGNVVSIANVSLATITTSFVGWPCPQTYDFPISMSSIGFPIWLNAGQVISTGTSSASGVLVSGIEFNIQ